MSGSQTEEITINRRPRGERPERQVHREDNAPTLTMEVDGGGDTIDPTQALAESQRLLKEQETRLANEQRLRQQAEARERQAAQSSATRQHQDRQTVVASTISSAESAIAAARTAYRGAREAGDLDAETEAQSALAAASAQFDRASAELEWLKSQTPAAPAAPQPNGSPSVSAETQAWLDSHPAYFQDDEYQAMAQFAHGKAVAAGHKSGSKQYVDFIDKYLEGKYGDGHGQVGGAKQVSQSRERGGEIAPTRRTQNSGTGGYKTAKVGNLGSIQYLDTADGRRVKMSKEMSDICREGAEVCRMPLDEYVNDQILIAQEIEAGGTGDIIYGDGKRNG